MTDILKLSFDTSPADTIGLFKAMVLEGNWRKAIKSVSRAYTPNLSVSQAMGLLSGALSFSAEGDLVAKPDEAYQAELVSRWGMLFQVQDKWYRPVKCVQLPLEPLSTTLSQFEQALFSIEEFLRYTEQEIQAYRAQAGVDDSDGRLFGFDEYAVLCQEVVDPPLWVEDRSKRDVLGSFILSLSEPVPALSDLEVLELVAKEVLDPYALTTANPLLSHAMQRYQEALDNGHDPLPPLALSWLKGWYYGEKVRQVARAGEGFITLKRGDQQWEVPKTPFLRWAETRCVWTSAAVKSLREDLKQVDWQPICPPGLKMAGDDACHTDWIVGAGLTPGEAYYMDHPLNKAAWNYASRLSEVNGKQFIKLSGAGTVEGRVRFISDPTQVGDVKSATGEIFVVDAASPEYTVLLPFLNKQPRSALLCCTGGKLCHLAIVSKEQKACVGVMANAYEKLLEGGLYRLNFDDGTMNLVSV